MELVIFLCTLKTFARVGKQMVSIHRHTRHTREMLYFLIFV